LLGLAADSNCKQMFITRELQRPYDRQAKRKNPQFEWGK